MCRLLKFKSTSPDKQTEILKELFEGKSVYCLYVGSLSCLPTYHHTFVQILKTTRRIYVIIFALTHLDDSRLHAIILTAATVRHYFYLRYKKKHRISIFHISLYACNILLLDTGVANKRKCNDFLSYKIKYIDIYEKSILNLRSHLPL